MTTVPSAELSCPGVRVTAPGAGNCLGGTGGTLVCGRAAGEVPEIGLVLPAGNDAGTQISASAACSGGEMLSLPSRSHGNLSVTWAGTRSKGTSDCNAFTIKKNAVSQARSERFRCPFGSACAITDRSILAGIPNERRSGNQ